MKTFILFLMSIYCYALKFNENSIVQILDNDNNILCYGVIITDRNVVSSDYCFNIGNSPPAFIKYRQNIFQITGNTDVSLSFFTNDQDTYDVSLFMINNRFRIHDIVAIPNDFYSTDKDFMNKYLDYECGADDIFINEEEGFKNPEHHMKLMHLPPDQWRFVSKGEISKNYIMLDSFARADYELPSNPHRFFLWRICNNQYQLNSMYTLSHRYINISNYYEELFNSVKSLLYNETHSKYADNISQSGRDMSSLYNDYPISSVKFVDFPEESDHDVNNFIRDVKKAFFIPYNGKLFKIPFTNNCSAITITASPCSVKVDYMLLYLYKHNPYHLKFVTLLFYSGEDYYFMINSTSFTSHVTLGYISRETKKIMVVDPEVSDQAFELNFKELKDHWRIYKISALKDPRQMVYYFVNAPNIFVVGPLIVNHNDTKIITDDIYDYVLQLFEIMLKPV